MRYYGCRALDIEVAEPTLAESPGTCSSALIERGRRWVRRADAARPRRDGAHRRSARRARRRRLATSSTDALARAESVYGVRDDNVFLAIDAPLALVRYAALEVGGRLAARGTLDFPTTCST